MISAAISNAVSGYNAATARIQSSANNIANANTTSSVDGSGNVTNDPYTPTDAQQVTGGGGSVQTVDRPRDPPSTNVYDPGNAAANQNGVTAYPNVDPAQELVKINIASYDAKANLSVIKEESKRLGDLLDIFS